MDTACLFASLELRKHCRWRILSSAGLTLLSCPHLQPLLHAIIFIIELAVAMRLAAKFNSYYAEKPGKRSRPLICVLGETTDVPVFYSADYDGYQCCKPAGNNTDGWFNKGY